jgi:hypothetical protein
MPHPIKFKMGENQGGDSLPPVLYQILQNNANFKNIQNALK